jgi:hypothetical protein
MMMEIVADDTIDHATISIHHATNSLPREWRKHAYAMKDTHNHEPYVMPAGFLRNAFRDACCPDHSPAACYTVRSLFAQMDLETLRSDLPYLNCAECWRALLLICEDNEDCAKLHDRALSPQCAFCCAAYHGYRAIDAQLFRESAHSSAHYLRFAFLNACHECDVMCAQRLYMRYILHEPEMALEILRAGVQSACSSEFSARVIVDFLASCYFPRNLANVNSALLWFEIDFVAYFDGNSRNDILAYLATPEGSKQLARGQWMRA